MLLFLSLLITNIEQQNEEAKLTLELHCPFPRSQDNNVIRLDDKTTRYNTVVLILTKVNYAG